jgi:SAM-dependent methyltransferase
MDMLITSKTVASHSPADYRAVWDSKPVLRLIYHDLYRRLAKACRPGKTLEIGSGSGNLKRELENVISTDIQAARWLDAVADAQSLPFGENTFDNVVMVDVLHHLSYPLRFLKEASRVLRANGCIVMLEPAVTPISWIFYKLFHPEPTRMSVDPFADSPLSDEDDPWDSNQAIPTLLFRRHRAEFEEAVPNLKVARFEYLSLFTVPLSGGFRSWSVLPTRLVKPLLSMEAVLLPFLGSLMAYRSFVVLKREA